MLELAILADREAVNEISRQVHALHVSWRPDLYEMVEIMYPEERFMEAIQSRSLYVAKLGGTVVGYVSLNIHQVDHPGAVKRKIMEIHEFAVHESCRGQGIGTAMMVDLWALASAFRCTDMKLNVYPQNDAAVGFYQKCGFQIQNIGMQKKI